MKNYQSFSSATTKKIGRALAKKILKSGQSCSRKVGASVLALEGELGSGKTTFVQGFFSGLGLYKRATSPTFILFRRFSLHSAYFKNVYHFDVYRLREPKDLSVLDFKKIIKDPQNIVLIEWAEKIKKLLPKNVIWLKFSHGRAERERTVEIYAKNKIF